MSPLCSKQSIFMRNLQWKFVSALKHTKLTPPGRARVNFRTYFAVWERFGASISSFRPSLKATTTGRQLFEEKVQPRQNPDYGTPMYTNSPDLHPVDYRVWEYCKRRSSSLICSGALGWVTPGAATEGVTPLIFFLKNLATFFSRQFCGVTPDFFFAKTDDLFAHRFIAFYCFHSGVTPSRVSPYTFLPVRSRFSIILCKFAHKIFFLRVSPLEGVTRGGPSPQWRHCWPYLS